MPKILAQLPSPSCYRLFPDPGIANFQWLGPDPFLPRARHAHVHGSPHSERAQFVCNKERKQRPGLLGAWLRGWLTWINADEHPLAGQSITSRTC